MRFARARRSRRASIAGYRPFQADIILVGFGPSRSRRSREPSDQRNLLESRGAERAFAQPNDEERSVGAPSRAVDLRRVETSGYREAEGERETERERDRGEREGRERAYKELSGAIRVRQETDNKNPIDRSTNPPRRAVPGKTYSANDPRRRYAAPLRTAARTGYKSRVAFISPAPAPANENACISPAIDALLSRPFLSGRCGRRSACAREDDVNVIVPRVNYPPGNRVRVLITSRIPISLSLSTSAIFASPSQPVEIRSTECRPLRQGNVDLIYLCMRKI